MKKLLVCVFALALALTLAAGCAKQPEPQPTPDPAPIENGDEIQEVTYPNGVSGVSMGEDGRYSFQYNGMPVTQDMYEHVTGGTDMYGMTIQEVLDDPQYADRTDELTARYQEYEMTTDMNYLDLESRYYGFEDSNSFVNFLKEVFGMIEKDPQFAQRSTMAGLL
jgi:hypothetical protein